MKTTMAEKNIMPIFGDRSCRKIGTSLVYACRKHPGTIDECEDKFRFAELGMGSVLGSSILAIVAYAKKMTIPKAMSG